MADMTGFWKFTTYNSSSSHVLDSECVGIKMSASLSGNLLEPSSNVQGFPIPTVKKPLEINDSNLRGQKIWIKVNSGFVYLMEHTALTA